MAKAAGYLKLCRMTPQEEHLVLQHGSILVGATGMILCLHLMHSQRNMLREEISDCFHYPHNGNTLISATILMVTISFLAFHMYIYR